MHPLPDISSYKRVFVPSNTLIKKKTIKTLEKRGNVQFSNIHLTMVDELIHYMKAQNRSRNGLLFSMKSSTLQKIISMNFYF